MPKVAVIMGSKSDLPILENTIRLLKKFNIESDVRVLSAHRTPDATAQFARQAESNGIEIIIAAAGKAAHLAGVIASHTTLPIIGIPVMSQSLDGLDALLSTVQMPPGIPVATVGINAADNAALLAVAMLSLKYDNLKAALADYRAKMTESVIAANAALSDEISKY